MHTISDNKHIKMILCLAFAVAMVLLSSACSAENSKGNNEAVDQSNISDITLDEDSPDKNFPVADETTENSQANTAIGEQEMNDAVAPKSENSLSTNHPTDTTDKPSPNTAPQPQENAVEDNPQTEPADAELYYFQIRSGICRKGVVKCSRVMKRWQAGTYLQRNKSKN